MATPSFEEVLGSPEPGTISRATTRPTSQILRADCNPRQAEPSHRGLRVSSNTCLLERFPPEFLQRTGGCRGRTERQRGSVRPLASLIEDE
jgi:hypothetical protein